MLTYALARLTALIPSRFKYPLAPLKPLYYHCLHGLQPIVQINLAGGTLNWEVNELTSQTHLLATYEPYMQLALQQYLKPGSVCYDIGAYAGFHTLVAALQVADTGHVYAFEPNPNNVAVLQRQVILNPALSISVIPYGLSDHSGAAALEVQGRHSQGYVSPTGDIPIQLRQLDELVTTAQIRPPNLLKLDVEGHEGAVLRGARTTLQQYRPIILCDYNDDQTTQLVAEALVGLAYRLQITDLVTALPLELS